MEIFFDFILKNWFLVFIWLSIVLAILVVNRLQSGPKVNAQQVVQLMNNESAVLIDLRDGKDYKQGHIKGAVHIPSARLEQSWGVLEKHRETPLVLVCKMGQVSPGVGRTLRKKGYENVHILARGVLGWQDENLPLIKG